MQFIWNFMSAIMSRYWLLAGICVKGDTNGVLSKPYI